LLNKAKVTDQEQDVDSEEEAELAEARRRAHMRTAVIWFTAPNAPASFALPTNTQFGVYRALFPAFETAGDYLEELRRLQLPTTPVPEEEERRIALLMVAGGHFAGMIVSLRPKGKSERQEVKGAGDVRVLQHKTFHRYTSELAYLPT